MTDVQVVDTSPAPSSERAPRTHSRLPDHILIAAHRACDLREFEAAMELLVSVENALRNAPAVVDRRHQRDFDSLVAAHERLWMLRHEPKVLDRLF